MNECANGSIKMRVKGLKPSLILSNYSNICPIFPENYLSLSTKELFPFKLSDIFYNKPSTVVKTPPSVP
jgi:hypothetical protein